jgi:thiamine pyrophosphate-dependent acetolactate synthase large subunit-like protein
VEACGDRLDHAGLMDVLGRILPPDTLTVLDGNISMLAAERFMSCHSRVCRINAGSNGTIGIGVPMAIGAKLARPEHPVVAICGDFAFGLGGFEVETAARHRVPIVVVVVDDGGTNAGTVQRAHYPPDHDLVAGLPRNLRYDRLAESLGAQGEWVDSKALLGPAIERALSSRLPVVVHVRVA